MSPEAAVAELRRVAGAQFDPAIVELFARLLSSRELGFRHADDVDFESELRFEPRVREYARRGGRAIPRTG